MNNKKKSTAIYMRVSSASQINEARDVEGHSIPAQREACQRYADRLGVTVIAGPAEPGESEARI